MWKIQTGNWPAPSLLDSSVGRVLRKGIAKLWSRVTFKPNIFQNSLRSYWCWPTTFMSFVTFISWTVYTSGRKSYGINNFRPVTSYFHLLAELMTRSWNSRFSKKTSFRSGMRDWVTWMDGWWRLKWRWMQRALSPLTWTPPWNKLMTFRLLSFSNPDIKRFLLSW